MDRDYMRERRDADSGNAFRPPEARSDSLLWILLFWVVVLFLLFKAFSWWEQRAHPTRRSAPSLASQHVEAERLPSHSVGFGAERAGSLPRERTCIRNGVTIPWDDRCTVDFSMPRSGSGGNRQAAAPEQTNTAPASTPGEIYLCKAYDGGTFWAQAHCNRHRAHIDRIVRVPAGLPFDQQVHIAEQQRDATRAASIAAMPRTVQQEHPAAASRVQCAALEQEIERIDARARQPLTAYEQDRLAERRKQVRDAQFRIRC